MKKSEFDLNLEEALENIDSNIDQEFDMFLNSNNSKRKPVLRPCMERLYKAFKKNPSEYIGVGLFLGEPKKDILSPDWKAYVSLKQKADIYCWRANTFYLYDYFDKYSINSDPQVKFEIESRSTPIAKYDNKKGSEFRLKVYYKENSYLDIFNWIIKNDLPKKKNKPFFNEALFDEIGHDLKKLFKANGLPHRVDSRTEVLSFLNSIKNRFNKIDIFSNDHKVRMEDQYIPIQVSLPNEPRYNFEKLSSYSESVEHPAQPNIERGVNFNLSHNLESWEETEKKYNRIMVRGDPGIGKTTLLKMVACKTAKGAIKKLSMDKASLNDIPFPVFITFYDIYNSKSEVYDAIVQITVRDFPRVSKRIIDILKEKLDQGKCVLLFDDFDEVPVEEQKQLARKVNRFLENYDCKLICTYRKTAYIGNFFQFDKEVEIEPFGENQTNQYIKNWINNEFSLKNQGEVLVARVSTVLKNKTQFIVLAQNPRLLSLICRLYIGNKTSPPERRVEIYKEAFHYVIEERGQIRKPKSEWWISAEKLMLENLAFHFSKKGNKIFSDNELIQWLDRYLEHKNSPKILKDTNALEILREISIENGIIKRIDNKEKSYKFIYQAFHELLAASYLYRKYIENPENGLSLVKKVLWDFNWHEIIILLAGLMKNPLVLINAITDEPDDVFHTQLTLAVRCIVECSNIHHPILNDIVKKFYNLSKKFSLSTFQYIAPTIYELAQANTCIIDLMYTDYRNGSEVQRLIVCSVLRGIRGNIKVSQFFEEALYDKSRSIRKIAIQEVLKSDNKSAINFLSNNFNDLDSDFKCLALRSIPIDENSNFIAILKKILKSSDEDLTIVAIETLFKIDTNEAYRILYDIFDDKSQTLKLKLLDCMNKIENDEALTLLRKSIKNKDPVVRRVSVEYLEEFSTPEANELILNVIEDEDNSVRNAAVSCLGQIKGKKALSFLKHALCDKDPLIRSSAIESLEEIGGKNTLDLLLKTFKDEDSSVRRAVVRSLKNMPGKKTLPYLSKAIKDKDLGVRISAVRSLKEIGNSKALKLLSEAFGDKDYYVRGLSFGYLAEVADGDFSELANKALRDETGYVRRIATSYLDRLETNAALKLLKISIHDSSNSVRASAVETLGKTHTKKAFDLLKKALKDKESKVREAAVNAIGRIGTNEGFLLLSRALDDQSKSVKYVAAKAIGEIGSEKAQELLIAKLNEKDQGLKIIAAQYLAKKNNSIIIDPLISLIKEQDNVKFFSHIRKMAVDCLETVGDMQVINKLNENKLVNIKNADIYGLVQRLAIRNCREKDFKPVYLR